MPNHEKLMTLIKTLLDYLMEDYNCNKCPCHKTEYCHACETEGWQDWECQDGIYEWVMNH